RTDQNDVEGNASGVTDRLEHLQDRGFTTAIAEERAQQHHQACGDDRNLFGRELRDFWIHQSCNEKGNREKERPAVLEHIEKLWPLVDLGRADFVLGGFKIDEEE